MINEINGEQVNVVLADLPHRVHEVVTLNPDGYMVALNSRDTRERNMIAFWHAVKHIKDDDFWKADADQIEADKHG